MIIPNSFAVTGTSFASPSGFSWPEVLSNSILGPTLFGNYALGGASSGLPVLYQIDGVDAPVDSVEQQTETLIQDCQTREEQPEVVLTMPMGNDTLVTAIANLQVDNTTVHPDIIQTRETFLQTHTEQELYQHIAAQVVIPSIERAKNRVEVELPGTQFIVVKDFDMQNSPLVISYQAEQSVDAFQFACWNQLEVVNCKRFGWQSHEPFEYEYQTDGIHLNEIGMRALASYIAGQLVTL